MRIGVVGCGYWGSKHVRVLHGIPDVEHVVAIDPSEERLLALKRSFPNMLEYRSLEAALAYVDAVIVATPPRTHLALAMTAMADGKGVLIEKPLATSGVDAQLLLDASRRRGVTLMVGHTFEHNSAVWKLRDLIRSGEIGEIHYLDSARLNLGLYQSDVNVIWDLAPHDVSIFNYILGSTPSLVQAWGSRHAHRDARGCGVPAPDLRGPGRHGEHPRQLAGPLQGPPGHGCREPPNGRLQRPLL